MSNDSNARPTKNERRQQAREQARIAREKEQKREKRNRLFVQGGVVLGVIAILAIVGIVIAQSMAPAGPGPKNMASGGAIFGKDLKVVEGPALQPDETRKAPKVNREELPLDVTIYADYMCPACGAFEQENGTMLENYVGSGDITLQVYPLNFLDAASLGTKYSTRAANLFGCVVEQQPDSAFKLHNLLLSPEVQPAEGSEGLSDDELLEQAEAAGATVDDKLKQCVSDRRFADFVAANTKAATETGIVGLAKGAQLAADRTGSEMQPADEPQRLISTPLVIVNGEQWLASRDGSLESYLLKVKGEIEQKNGGNGKNAKADASAKAEGEASAKGDASAAAEGADGQ
ncbi:DsbA family protein [Leucobacter ruminantium]|uniref:Thioredoxin domain-containing protein n=1 Tax=Leucobacter ruminantium TaxID=1289170 RepID=A0A939M1I1_9MICO|nr:thioredoxin domain-containing protein [Leucobacter ruminantium]MBO1805335.1 thioredoxin domain-containing protein [Leucobacter ruminantium]